MRTTLHRTLTAAPLFAVAALSVAGLAGGIASAAPADFGSLSGSADLGLSEHTWTVKNDTKDSVWGEIDKQEGSKTSKLEWSANAPLQPNAAASATQGNVLTANEYTWGRICYRGAWWNLTRQDHIEPSFISVQTNPTDPNTLVVRGAESPTTQKHDLPLVKTPGDSGCTTPAA